MPSLGPGEIVLLTLSALLMVCVIYAVRCGPLAGPWRRRGGGVVVAVGPPPAIEMGDDDDLA